MDQQTREFFKSIKDDFLLERILPTSFQSAFLGSNLSLLEVIDCDTSLMLKQDSVGAKKIADILAFKSIFENDALTKTFKESVEKHRFDLSISAEKQNVEMVLMRDFDTDKEPIELINECLVLLTLELENAISRLPEGKNKKYITKLNDYIISFFGINSEVMDGEEIGKKYGLTGTAVIIFMFSTKGNFNLRDFITNGQIYAGLIVNPDFINHIDNAFKKLHNKTLPFNVYQNFNALKVQHMLSLFDYDVFIDKDDTDQIPYLIKSRSNLYFEQHLLFLSSALRSGLPLTQKEILNKAEDYVINLTKNRKNQSIITQGIDQTLIETLLDESHLIEKLEDESSELYYRLRWKYQPSNNARATYILYDAGQALSKEDIIGIATRLNSENDITTSISIDALKANHPIVPIGKTGKWQLVTEDVIHSKHIDYLSDLLLNQFKGKASFQDIIASIDNSKKEVYPNATTRTYLLSFARLAKRDNNLFVHEQSIDKYPEIELQPKRNKNIQNAIINAIVKAVKENKGISKKELLDFIKKELEQSDYRIPSDRNIKAVISNCVELGFVERSVNNTGNETFELVALELEKYDLTKIGKRKEPEYKRELLSEVINHLKSVKEERLSELKKKFEHHIPNNISKGVFYKIIDAESLLLKKEIKGEKFIHLAIEQLPIPELPDGSEVQARAPIMQADFRYERKKFILSELKNATIRQVAKLRDLYLDEDTLEIGFNLFYESLKNKKGELPQWADAFLQCLYQVMCAPSDQYDRYLCLKDLTLSYETYFKRFIIGPIDTKGQHEAMDLIPQLKDLKSYKFLDRSQQLDFQKKNFSFILGRMISFANKYRHQRDHEVLDFTQLLG